MSGSEWEVLLTESIDSTGLESLTSIADVTRISEYEDSESLRADADRFDAVLVRTHPVDQELLENAENLKVVSKHGTGLDNVDIQTASDEGVLVCNTPHVNSSSVAEHTLALLLGVRKRLLAADRDVRQGEWEKEDHITNLLRGHTLGLFGCGAIGREVGELVQHLGMDCIGYDPYVDESELPADMSMVDDKNALFDRSDAVSVHTPLTDETYHAISTNELTRLPEHGIVVNTSRGGVIDEKALAAALGADEIMGAGLDVFATEPPSSDNPLFEFETVIATPHIGGSTAEALEELSVRAAENIRTVYDGDVPETTVNANDVKQRIANE